MFRIDIPMIDTPHMVLLDPKEIYAIGMVTAQWAELERIIRTSAVHFYEMAGQQPPERLFSISFNIVRKEWRAAVKIAPIPAERKKTLLAFGEKIVLLRDKRRRIIHGAADRGKDPATIRFSQRHTKEADFSAESDFGAIKEIAEELSRLNRDLLRVLYPRTHA